METLSMSYTSVIIVPCYNEFARMPADHFIDHLKLHPHHAICFVNDGSTDKTGELLQDIAKVCSNAKVLSLPKNQGKALAVYEGVKHISKDQQIPFIGYMDADLATPLSFIEIMENELGKGNTWMVFGSRKLAGREQVERRAFRHYSGRLVSAMITWALGKKYGDTQCGAKLFAKEGIEKGFHQPFTTSWIFDVEIIKRLLNQNGHVKIREIAVNQWKDVGNSKVSTWYFFKMLSEIFRIKKLKN